jgi:general stress protein 26
VNRRLKDIVIDLLNGHRIMSISTNRPDGWPQTTLVGYVNDGFLLYCFVARNSQKYANILRDPRISIAIGSDVADPRNIKGLSLAAKASVVTDPAEFDYVSELRLKRNPEYATLSPPTEANSAAIRMAPKPMSEKVARLRIAPEIISVVDYSKGFGHSDLITFSERDLDLHIASLRHHSVDDRGPNNSVPDDKPSS